MVKGAIDVLAFATVRSIVLAGTSDGVWKSLDSGKNWTALRFSGGLVTALAVGGYGTLFAATEGGVMCSIDGGDVWTLGKPGLSPLICNALATRGLYDLFAGTDGGGVLLSHNHGNGWFAFNTGLTSAQIHAFALIDTTLFVGTHNGVFQTTDNDTSWIKVDGGLTNNSVQSFAVSDKNIFAGTYGEGVYLSSTNGASWNAVNSGLTNDTVFSLGVSGKYLFAGIIGGSVWCRLLSDMISSSSVAEQSKASESIAQAYPNPFSEKTTVRFMTSERGPVEVSVVNLLGVEVTRLYNGELDAGEHSFEWDAKNAAAGTYFCIVRMNNRVERVAMVLAR